MMVSPLTTCGPASGLLPPACHTVAARSPGAGKRPRATPIRVADPCGFTGDCGTDSAAAGRCLLRRSPQRRRGVSEQVAQSLERGNLGVWNWQAEVILEALAPTIEPVAPYRPLAASASCSVNDIGDRICAYGESGFYCSGTGPEQQLDLGG